MILDRSARHTDARYNRAMPAAFFAFFVLLGLGYLARRSGRFPDNAADTLNLFVIDVCLPALVLRVVPTLSPRWDLMVLVITPWVITAVAWLAVALGRRLFRWDTATSTALFLCSALGNTAFLGFPLVSALLGEHAMPFAVVYDQLGSFFVLTTIAPIAIARAQGSGAPRVSTIVKRVLVFPPFLALLVALLPLPRPDWFTSVLTTISQALVPSAIFAVGLRMRITPPRERSAFVYGLSLKLVVLPACALAISRAFAAEHDVMIVNVLQSGMPAMVTAGALAMMAGLAPELAAALVGWGIVASIVSLQAWHALLT